jgi:MFS family permease
MNNGEGDAPQPRGWLNPTVLGAGLTSFLADVCYEMAAAVLPGFMYALGLPAFALTGLVEGAADATSNFAKLGAGWYSDRLGRRKPLVVLGYALTGLTQAFFALGWPVILVAKLTGWLGKGIRGPLRNAILADAVAPQDRGKAFGLHRAGDTVGAVIGPLIGAALIQWLPAEWFADAADPYRVVFLLTLIPGIGAVLAFGLLVRERSHAGRPEMEFWASLRELPRPFYRLLVGVGVFGLGDFTDKLLILTAVRTLAPSLGERDAIAFGVVLFACRNVVQALTAFPIGVASDRFGPRRPLIVGYLLGVATMLGFAAVTHLGLDSRVAFLALFALAGVYLSVEEALEGVLTADLVPDRTLRGTAYGLMGSVNGVGDLVASLAAGLLMQHVSLPAAFLYAAVTMLLGTALLARLR